MAFMPLGCHFELRQRNVAGVRKAGEFSEALCRDINAFFSSVAVLPPVSSEV